MAFQLWASDGSPTTGESKPFTIPASVRQQLLNNTRETRKLRPPVGLEVR